MKTDEGKRKKRTQPRINLVLGFLEQLLRRIYGFQREGVITNFINSAVRQISLG
jgi:hypothetical protein